jgi:hypothetical protein
MILESVEVRSFRTLGHVNVKLSAGLNVIYGENDTGKSTLMDAIRECLTLRARGTSARHTCMRPHCGGDPEVCVVFSLGETTYAVRKKFGARGTTHLNVRAKAAVGRDYSGDEAEQALRCALGLPEETSRRGGDLGVLPVLWVEQGTSGSLPSLEGQASANLSERLRELSGEIIGGENGERIYKAIDEAFSKTFSSRGPRAESDLQRANDSRAVAATQLQELESRQGVLATAAGRFDDIGVRLASVQASLPGLTVAVDAADQALLAVRERASEHDRVAAQVSVAIVASEQASDRSRRRLGERRAVADARARSSERQGELSLASERFASHDAARAPLSEELARAEALERNAAEEAATAQHLAVQHQTLHDLAILDERVAQCRGYDLERIEASRRALAEQVDAKVLAKVDALHREAEIASSALGLSATTVELRASESAIVRFDGEQVHLPKAQTTARTVTAAATIQIGDALEVTIRPGGAELEGLRVRADDAQNALTEALSRIGASSVAEVRERAASRAECERCAAVATQMLAATAPQGLSSVEAERRSLQEQLEQAPGGVPPADVAQDITNTRAHAAEARNRADEARRASDGARRQLASFDASRDRLNGDVRVATEALSGAVQALAGAEMALSASVAAVGHDEGLDAALAEQVALRRAAEDRLREIASKLTAGAVAEAQDRLRRAQNAVKLARGEEERLQQESYRLEVDLQAPDILGLDDRTEGARVALAQAEAELRRLTEQGEALRLLYELLRDERAAARTRFLSPLSREIQPLLNLMYPGAKVELDEHFAVTRLERVTDGAHDFEALGGGSREQLAILVRLAMARVLGAGTPLPVMLDDAIVFTSDVRFARMGDVLVSAAAGLQLLVFTCHWDRYRGLGPDNVVDLEEARAQGEASSPKHAA